MALPSRGGMLLSRAMAAHATPARAFSTSIPFRFSPAIPLSSSSYHLNRPNYPNRNREQNPPAKISPLVGDYSPPPPEPKKDFSPPPPPPRHPTTSTARSTAADSAAAPAKSGDEASKGHAYNAEDAFSNLVADLLSQKAADFGASLAISDPLDRPRVRTKAVTGRTVFIKERLTPTSAPTPMVAIRVLERLCREQKVKNKFHSQKFHERKGLKKKRLRSERWRARFKVGFKAAVKKVVELKKQGW